MTFFIFGLFIGSMLGIGVMCLMAMARDPHDVDTGCTGDCDQGRRCTCVGVRGVDQAHQ